MSKQISETRWQSIGWWLTVSVALMVSGCGSIHQGMDHADRFEYELADGIGNVNSGIMTLGDDLRDAAWRW